MEDLHLNLNDSINCERQYIEIHTADTSCGEEMMVLCGASPEPTLMTCVPGCDPTTRIPCMPCVTMMGDFCLCTVIVARGVAILVRIPAWPSPRAPLSAPMGRIWLVIPVTKHTTIITSINQL